MSLSSKVEESWPRNLQRKLLMSYLKSILSLSFNLSKPHQIEIVNVRCLKLQTFRRGQRGWFEETKFVRVWYGRFGDWMRFLTFIYYLFLWDLAKLGLPIHNCISVSSLFSSTFFKRNFSELFNLKKCTHWVYLDLDSLLSSVDEYKYKNK